MLIAKWCRPHITAGPTLWVWDLANGTIARVTHTHTHTHTHEKVVHTRPRLRHIRPAVAAHL